MKNVIFSEEEIYASTCAHVLFPTYNSNMIDQMPVKTVLQPSGVSLNEIEEGYNIVLDRQKCIAGETTQFNISLIGNKMHLFFLREYY